MSSKAEIKLGLLSYFNTGNLGDEIQSIAVERLAPRVDVLLDRDRLSEFKASKGQRVKLVCNGWFSHHPQCWPPSSGIEPLLISMHFSRQESVHGIDPAAFMLSASVKKYLQEFGPVGARDLATLELLTKNDVDAYFSGCVTLTLKPSGGARQREIVVLNDVPAPVYEYVQARTRKPIVVRSSSGIRHDPEQRRAEARDLLALLESASCVITSRLHTALPCLALGTPVVLLDIAADRSRFQGLTELVRHGSVEELLADKLINVNDPWNNPSDHVAIADNIAGRIAEFFSAKPRDIVFDAAQSTRLGLTAEIMRMRSEIVGLKARASCLEKSLAEKHREDTRSPKNLDIRMKSPELVHYLNRHYKSVPGFSSLLSARVNAELLLWQRAQNIGGSVAELGVYLGRSAIALALATDAPDRFLAMDKFVWPDNALERFRAFSRKFGVSEDRLVPLAADARDVTPQQLLSAVEGHAYRFFHVDGDHAPEALRKDLELVSELMSKEGIICLDDMLHPLYPELPVVVHRFLQKTDFRVFGIIDREDAVAATKYLLCRSHMLDKYQQALRAMFPDLVFPGDAEFENSKAVILSLDSAVIPYYQRLNAPE